MPEPHFIDNERSCGGYLEIYLLPYHGCDSFGTASLCDECIMSVYRPGAEPGGDLHTDHSILIRFRIIRVRFTPPQGPFTDILTFSGYGLPFSIT